MFKRTINKGTMDAEDRYLFWIVMDSEMIHLFWLFKRYSWPVTVS